MLSKLALTALIVGIVWILAARGTRGAIKAPFRRRAKPIPPAETLVECPACGACRPAGAPCPCRTEG